MAGSKHLTANGLPAFVSPGYLDPAASFFRLQGCTGFLRPPELPLAYDSHLINDFSVCAKGRLKAVPELLSYPSAVYIGDGSSFISIQSLTYPPAPNSFFALRSTVTYNNILYDVPPPPRSERLHGLWTRRQPPSARSPLREFSVQV
ncbi:hypothetical protein PM082_023457 [Marasmius tenuissimus]|nr:hypothetical protein PM082_023457 [Marasmius tenuissimus]